MILETLQGGAGIVLPPPGYLREVRRLCNEHRVLWIADEVQCGVGRTGRFFVFEHEGVLPDLVTLGTGEACATALEALAVLYDDDLMGNAEQTGKHLLCRLEELRRRYPELVTDVRGAGLMVGLQLAGISAAVPRPLRRAAQLLDGGLPAGSRGWPAACCSPSMGCSSRSPSTTAMCSAWSRRRSSSLNTSTT
ncbi:MAG: aminotransferase class III-fold pyridoxal phosphate-dependent enzyme [Pseudonocardiaceae bacterium]